MDKNFNDYKYAQWFKGTHEEDERRNGVYKKEPNENLGM